MKIAPSLLSADFADITGAIAAIEAGGADLVHLDVMDGRFVPNLTWGPKVIGDLRKLTKLPFDVHLMIEEPERYIEAFRKAGADGLTVHLEAGPHTQRTVTQIRSLGAKAGVVICPGTPVAMLGDLIYDVDLLLIMSVNPGFGGQAFLPRSLDRLRQARALIEERNPGCALEVDGGVSEENIAAVVAAGADTIVMGSSIFDTPDPAAAIKKLRALAERAGA
jgi:ribulose-phosphate 3-epimerase